MNPYLVCRPICSIKNILYSSTKSKVFSPRYSIIFNKDLDVMSFINFCCISTLDDIVCSDLIR